MATTTEPRTKLRVLFLNRSYYPDAEATGQLLTQLCEDLAADFQVRVIAGQPNSNPSGADFVAVGEERRREVTIQRVRHTRFSKASMWGRLVNWTSYLVTAAWAAIRAPRPDLIVVETDPPLLCLLGAFLKRWFGCQLVVYLQDLYPDLGIAIGKLPDHFLLRGLRAAFIRSYRAADRVVVLSDDMQQVLVTAGVPARSIRKIPNWVDTSRVVPIKEKNSFRTELGLQSEFLVMHSGNLGYCQGLESVVLAAERLRERSDIAWVFVGDGAARGRLEQMVADRRLDNVRFGDYQPMEYLSTSLSAADLHLVAVDARVVGYLMPSKFYGALASGTPVLAVAPPESELARIVEQERVGRVAVPGDPQSLADRIVEMAALPYDLREMGDRARRLAVERFDRAKSVGSFAEMLRELSGGAWDRAGNGSGVAPRVQRGTSADTRTESSGAPRVAAAAAPSEGTPEQSAENE